MSSRGPRAKESCSQPGLVDNARRDSARFPQAAYIDASARIFGGVEIAEGASLWPGAVIRAESQCVRIGRLTNLQDHVMVHVGYRHPTIVGDYCSITHRVVLHGCRIGDNCLIGIGATIMEGVVIGENSIIAGHSFVADGTLIPPNSIVMGTPGKVVRTANNFIANRINAMLYHRNALNAMPRASTAAGRARPTKPRRSLAGSGGTAVCRALWRPAAKASRVTLARLGRARLEAGLVPRQHQHLWIERAASAGRPRSWAARHLDGKIVADAVHKAAAG